MNNRFIIKYFFLILLLAVVSSSCKTTKTMSTTQVYAFRLKPGDDLKKSIQQFVEANNIAAAWVSTCVGSLTHYNIRFANQPGTSTAQGHFEIVSLVGTLSVNGSHLHLSISDSAGYTLGGHLADGNIVYTTAEVVITASQQHAFTRPVDPATGFKELQVENKAKQ